MRLKRSQIQIMNLTALTQATAIADSYTQPIDTSSPDQAQSRQSEAPKYTRLTQDEILAIIDLLALKKPHIEIAHTLNRSQSTISEFAAKLTDRRAEATLRLRNAMPELVERFVNRAGPPELLEVFDREDVSKRKQVDTGRGATVNIVVGMPGQPAGPDPIIVLSPTNTQQLTE